ncbi:hypothetical protein U14_00379 [Candidatus Moduliflexus flocculans]|uniref:Uncharacterized protein n=1 Tax=Candidatus Moduliflexus flocculans TaxID=1499966 RepID=A0A0S6VUD5_9BACT|nr:hypothetical protein U14_00379 [Candidatus Moduliflexus flocculans]
MDKFAIIIVLYVIATIFRLLSSAAKNQPPGKKTTQIRLKPEDLQRIAKRRQQTPKSLQLSTTATTPPPLPELAEPFFAPPPDEETISVAEELPEALEVREDEGVAALVDYSSAERASFLNAPLNKQVFQGMIWAEILRPPVSMRQQRSFISGD